jgi:predicted phage terminase large subunit-like protein
MLPKLNENEKKLLRLEIEREIYRRSFYEFFIAASQILYPQVEWQYPRFYKYICQQLQDAVERNVNREEKQSDYIYNLPFRAGKSILLSQIFPVWCWIKDSTLSIMQVSHNETLAIKHSHASKMLIESEWFQDRFPDIELRIDTHAKSNYMNSQGGKRTSFGVKSGIIGEGCNIMIIDDINNPADSQAVTQNINEIFTDTLYSRLNNPTLDFRVILQQRVASNDICQFILDSPNSSNYTHVCLPVRLASNINPPELVEMYQNGLLWCDRFTEKVIADFQATLGSRAFQGQLMQKPVSEAGNIIKRAWIQSISFDDFIELTENKHVVHAFIDTAYTSKSNENDASAIILATAFNNNVYVLKAWKKWLEFPELVKILKQIQQQYGVIMLYIESKASGLSVKQQLTRDGFNCGELNPKDKDKLSRVNAVTPSIEAGHLWFIKDNWNEMVLQELAGFPFGADDLTDCVVYSIDTLLNKSNFNYGF